MQKEILIAGFGGQGVLFAGQVLAYAAMDTGIACCALFSLNVNNTHSASLPPAECRIPRSCPAQLPNWKRIYANQEKRKKGQKTNILRKFKGVTPDGRLL